MEHQQEQHYLNYNSFREKKIKLRGRKNFKITNSYGTKEGWRWLKKNKWLNLGQPITERQFGKIIKEINLVLINRLLKGLDAKFPCRMGKLEVRKIMPYVRIENNKISTNYPINWAKTLHLWYTDKEAMKDKVLVRRESSALFKLLYNKHTARYKNKRFYQFSVARKVKLRLKDRINNNELDAFLL